MIWGVVVTVIGGGSAIYAYASARKPWWGPVAAVVGLCGLALWLMRI